MGSTKTTAAELRMQMWTARIQECKNSGKTIREWCKENGIAEKTYYYWHKKVSDRICTAVVREKDNYFPTNLMGNNVENHRFIEVKPIKYEHGSPVTMYIGETRITVDSDISDEFLMRLMKAVSHV